MFLRSFLDQIIYKKQMEAKFDNILSSRNLRKTMHDIRFKDEGLKYIKIINDGMNEECRLINELILHSYIEERK